MYGGNRKVFFENLAAWVQDLVKAGKLYTRNRLSLDDVADRLEVSRYYVSHAINKLPGEEFYHSCQWVANRASRPVDKADGNG